MLKALLTNMLLVLAFSAGHAHAGDSYLQSQAYYEDTSNSLTLEEVKREKFTVFNGWLTKGYRPSTYWIRLNIRPSDTDLVLRIRPAYVESIQLFDSVDSDGKRIVGAKYGTSKSDISTYNHNFNLGKDTNERLIYLRIKTSRTYLLNFEVMSASDFLSAEHTSNLIFVAYIVFSLSLALGLLGVWVINREPVLGMFVIQQFVAVAFTFFLYGYARFYLNSYIDESVINYITYLLVMIYPLIGAISNRLLFEEYSIRKTFHYLFIGAFLTSILVISLFVLGNVGVAMRINALLVILLGILFWLTAFFGTNAHGESRNINLPINVLRIYYTFNLIMWALLVFPAFGLIASNEFSAHSNLFYGLVSGIIFFWILQYRARSILKNEVLKSAALKKEVESEKLRREEQGKLMSMLTHEIRTPLSILKLVVDRKVAGSDLEDYANRAVSNIDSIIDKCIQLDRLDLNVLQIHKTKFNFLALLNSVISDGRLGDRFAIHGQADVNIQADVDILSIIISNLLGNAVKYSPTESSIDIDSEILEGPYSKRLQFSVCNKIGIMGAPDPSLAFEKYYRSPTAAKVSGSGLGLFLVRELVQALNGEVKLSIKDNFIQFTAWIPI